jgi:hypothetical protein
MSQSEPILPEEESTRNTKITAPSSATNTATKAALLNRAKAAIDAGEQSLHDCAEALAVAQELHGASQAEMARAIGKSEAWVSLLLQWRRSDYKGESPFGPRTKAGRLKHAKDRVTSGASKPRKPRKASTKPQTNADDPQVSADKRKAENARSEADTEAESANSTSAQASASHKPCKANTEPQADADDARGTSEPARQEAEAKTAASTSAAGSTRRKPSPVEAKGNLKYAIDRWWPYLDDAGKAEMTAYFSNKAGVRVS